MFTFKKGEATKHVDENSKLIPILEKGGWELAEEEKEVPKEALKKAKKSEEK